MSRHIGIAVLLLVVGAVIGMTLRPNIAADPPKEEAKEKPIPIDDVRKCGILGDLGHRLGTIVTVEGEAADGDETKLKQDAGRTLLRVKSVNGTDLKSEVVFRFIGKPEDKPKVGAKFRYVGYETGQYRGQVNGLWKVLDQMEFLIQPADVGYGFYTDFHIVKNELKPERK